jgi:hypothetical protein
MKIKSLLLGSAAALVAVSGVQAADAIVAAEPEPVEYVRVCDAFGSGYFYIPGTETCLRIHGYIRYDIGGGDLFDRTSATGDETYNQRTRFSFRTSTASETELGTLRTYTETRFQWDTNSNFNTAAPAGAADGYDTSSEFSVNFAWIELGGLRVGKSESAFITFTGYAGNVANDDFLFSAGPYDTNLLSYTYNSGAFSAILSLEQGVNSYGAAGTKYDANAFNGASGARGQGWGIDDYMPHVVAGVGYDAGMINLRGIFAWDSRDDFAGEIRGGWAAKLRADVTINDQASVFAMLLYGENSSGYTTWANGTDDDETFAVIAGGSYQLTEKASLNVQGNWRESNTAGEDDAWSLVGNVIYEVVPGLTVAPEIAWEDNGDVNDDGDFGGFLRVQRSF